MPAKTKGSCAASASNNPLGGRTRGLFNASSLMIISPEAPDEYREVFCSLLSRRRDRYLLLLFAGGCDRSHGCLSTTTDLRQLNAAKSSGHHRGPAFVRSSVDF